MITQKIICCIFGHDKGEKIFEKSFFSPSCDKWLDRNQSYCKRCGLSWPATVYHRRTLYHRTIPVWISRIRNKWIFRKYRWTKKRQEEYMVFIERQLKYFPEIYYGVKKANQLRQQAFSKLTSTERALFTEYDSIGHRIR
jgi:hypothetical protein